MEGSDLSPATRHAEPRVKLTHLMPSEVLLRLQPVCCSSACKLQWWPHLLKHQMRCCLLVSSHKVASACLWA